jgi:methyl-accepting chemotaxis protein
MDEGLMMTLALVQVGATPEWVAPTAAISLVVIAVSMLGAAAALAYAALRIVAETRKVSSLIQSHQDDVAQALAGTRRLLDQGQDVMVLLRQEIGAFTQTSRRIRRKLVRGVDNVEAKLADLETLYQLVHEEVEDTALDVAAALRTFRQGDGMLGRVRRLIVPSRR